MNKQILIINERKKLSKWLKIFYNFISKWNSIKRYFYSYKEQIIFSNQCIETFHCISIITSSNINDELMIPLKSKSSISFYVHINNLHTSIQQFITKR